MRAEAAVLVDAAGEGEEVTFVIAIVYASEVTVLSPVDACPAADAWRALCSSEGSISLAAAGIQVDAGGGGIIGLIEGAGKAGDCADRMESDLLIKIQGMLHKEIGSCLSGLGDARSRWLVLVAPDTGVADLPVVKKAGFGAYVEAVAEPGGKLKIGEGVADQAGIVCVDLVELADGYVIIRKRGNVVCAEAPAGGVGWDAGILRSFYGDDGEHGWRFVEGVNAAAGIIISCRC